jgi:translation initiation factor IF-1
MKNKVTTPKIKIRKGDLVKVISRRFKRPTGKSTFSIDH